MERYDTPEPIRLPYVAWIQILRIFWFVRRQNPDALNTLIKYFGQSIRISPPNKAFITEYLDVLSSKSSIAVYIKYVLILQSSTVGLERRSSQQMKDSLIRIIYILMRLFFIDHQVFHSWHVQPRLRFHSGHMRMNRPAFFPFHGLKIPKHSMCAQNNTTVCCGPEESALPG